MTLDPDYSLCHILPYFSLIKCIELNYTEELENILKNQGKHYTQEYLDKALFR